MGVGVVPSFFSPGVGVVGDIGAVFLSADFCASDELGVASSMSEARFSASGVLFSGVVLSMFTTGTTGMSGLHFLQGTYSVFFS